MILILFGGCQSASETLKNTDDTALTVFSSGCGLAPLDPLGGTQISIEVEGADLPRGFYLSLPDDYDSSKAHRLIFGFPGTDWVGSQVQPYLGLEVAETIAASNEIFETSISSKTKSFINTFRAKIFKISFMYSDL